VQKQRVSAKSRFGVMGIESTVMEGITQQPVLLGETAKGKQHKSAKKELMALSIFSGGGGLDLGFSSAGFKIGCSSDIDSYSCSTLVINKDKRPFYKHAYSITADITKVSADVLLKQAGLKRGGVDIVLGGPPCQAFSVFGRRGGLTDPRGGLVWDYLRIIKEVMPKSFVFENVAGIKSIHEGKFFEEILSALTLNGIYTVSVHSYQIANFGIPQFRDRVFVIGTQNGVSVPPMIQTHNTDLRFFTGKQYRTVEEALRYLPEPGEGSPIPNHVGRKHSLEIINRYESLSFGERDPKTRVNKLHPQKPSFTIIVGSDNGGGKGHIHPFVPREVTPRESARMQTFPDWWEFYGTGRHVIRQVGNAVPPLFAALLAEHIRVNVFGEKKQRNYSDFINILGLDYLRE
jgi:DNA (cytosine-5)-methyltransferase 1